MRLLYDHNTVVPLPRLPWSKSHTLYLVRMTMTASADKCVPFVRSNIRRKLANNLFDMPL